MKELYEGLEEDEKEYYNKLWMVTGRREAPIHPMVYEHPFRKEKDGSLGETTMLFHCGQSFVQGFYKDENRDGNGGVVDVNTENLIPAAAIQQKLTQSIESKLDKIGLRMKWQKGDFMINDNLGLAHYASQRTQSEAKNVGLRVLHRTTIAGGSETVPRKGDGRQSFTVQHSYY